MKLQKKKDYQQLSSQFKANSFCCVLNNVDKLFNITDTTFNQAKYTDETRQKVAAFRKQLDPNISYTPENIVDYLMKLWIEGKEDRRSVAVNYEIGDNGTHHCHMILEDKAQTRFSAILKLYPTIHVEMTRGTRDEIISYLRKEGKHAEKAHTIVVPMQVHGDIEGKPQGGRKDLEIIQDFLEKGFTPEDIMGGNLRFRKYSKIIKEHYYQLKVKAAPDIKEMTVFWHTGAAGSGKSFTQVKLQRERGREFVYVVTDYSNGGFDMYQGEPTILLEEFKGDVDYQYFLKLIDAYPIQVHARYTNAYALWNEVHIASIYDPTQIYYLMVPPERWQVDPIEQLYRRIHYVVYHFTPTKGRYCSLTFTMSDYLEIVQQGMDLEQLAQQYYQLDKNATHYSYAKQKGGK